MDTSTPFRALDAIRDSWHVVRREPAVFVALTVLQLGVSSIEAGGGRSALGLVHFVGHVLGAALAVGWWRVALRAHDGQPVTLGALTELRPIELLRYLVVGVLLALAVAVGLVVLIVPGVYLALRLGLAPIVVVDEGRDPIAALQRSWELTRVDLGAVARLAAALVGLNLLGLLALGVGVLVTMPISIVAAVHLHRVLASRAAHSPSIPFRTAQAGTP
jgi:uncharacterized membrane protein